MLEQEGLEKFRQEIDRQDELLLDAVSLRFALIHRVAQWKKEQGWPLHDPQREREMIADRIARGRSKGLDESFVVQLFELILSHSVQMQRRLVLDLARSRRDGSPMRMGVLRLGNTQSEVAVTKHFALDERTGWYQTLQELAQALLQSRIDFGVLPLLRKDGLVFPEILEQLITQTVSIVGEEMVQGINPDVPASRFLVLASTPPPPNAQERHATVLLFDAKGGTEKLAQSIWSLKQHGVEVSGLHQVPVEAHAQPMFLLFVAGGISEAPLRDALEEICCKNDLLKVIGSYPSFPCLTRPVTQAVQPVETAAKKAL